MCCVPAELLIREEAHRYYGVRRCNQAYRRYVIAKIALRWCVITPAAIGRIGTVYRGRAAVILGEKLLAARREDHIQRGICSESSSGSQTRDAVAFCCAGHQGTAIRPLRRADERLSTLHHYFDASNFCYHLCSPLLSF